MTRARHTTTWDALRPLHPPLSREAERVLRDYYNSLGANIPDPEPIDRHVPGPRTLRIIHNTIAQHPYSTARILTEHTGFSDRTINDALRHLVKHGQVTKHRHRNGRAAHTYTVRP